MELMREFLICWDTFFLEKVFSLIVQRADLKGLLAFCEEHPTTKAIVVSQDSEPRKIKSNDSVDIEILPWRIFLDRLWGNAYERLK